MPTPRQAKLSGKEKRTSTVAAKEYTARGDPWWNNGAGEQLKWRVKRLELPARLEVPDLDEEKLVRQTGDKPAKKDDEKLKADLEGLLPDLTAHILANATATKPSLIDGFVDRHKERKLTKKWVGDSISALASRSGKTWKLRPM